MANIPKGFTLDPIVDRAVIEADSYKFVTVSDLRRFLDGLADDCPAWISRYDDATETATYRPIESLAAASGPVQYVEFG